MRNGLKKKYEIFLFSLIKKIYHFNKNINLFFSTIHKSLYMPICLRVRVIAGKKVLIPTRITLLKEINVSCKLIFEAVKKRSERKLDDRVFNELVEIFLNKSPFSCKKRLQLCSDIKRSIPNLRFLKSF
jgi:ribosomal protein S7